MFSDDSNIQFRNSQTAFESAIADGVLSDLPTAPNYAGGYMYMYTAYQEGPDGEPVDYFKNRNTRRYVSAIAV